MSNVKADGLLDELERLRALLREEEDRGDLQQHIPVLTDIAESSYRRTIGTVSVGSDLQPALHPVYSDDPETDLKLQLRRQARLVIQEIIDEELVRVESRLNRELNNYLEHWLNQLDFRE